MEKKIKFQDVINFIEKSMENGYTVSPCGNGVTIGKSHKYNNDNGGYTVYNCFEFYWRYEDEKLIIGIGVSYNRDSEISDYTLKIEDSKKILEWKLLLQRIKEYRFLKLENRFDNFFKEEESKFKDINDLDDKED